MATHLKYIAHHENSENRKKKNKENENSANVTIIYMYVFTYLYVYILCIYKSIYFYKNIVYCMVIYYLILI